MEDNKNKIFKAVGAAVLALVVLYIFSGLLTGGRPGYGYNMNYGMSYGFGFSGLIASLLLLIIKILGFVFVVSLIVGTVVVLRKQVVDTKTLSFSSIEKLFVPTNSCPSCGAKTGQGFKFCPQCKASLANICTKCGGTLKAGWKCCPACGTDTNGQAN